MGSATAPWACVFGAVADSGSIFGSGSKDFFGEE
jgi:hypothetical protein